MARAFLIHPWNKCLPPCLSASYARRALAHCVRQTYAEGAPRSQRVQGPHAARMDLFNGLLRSVARSGLVPERTRSPYPFDATHLRALWTGLLVLYVQRRVCWTERLALHMRMRVCWGGYRLVRALIRPTR